MPHSSPETATSSPPSQSSSLAMKPWSPGEDAVLLQHALQCGTKQWGELEKSGQLRRNNKSCCNRYIFLKRKFVQRFQQNLLRKHLRRTLHFATYGHSHCQESQQQQQRQDGAVSPESQSAALSFGGLSYEECRSVFLSPNVRSSTNPHLPSLWIPPSASQTAVLTAAAANAPFSMSSFYPVTSPSKVAAVSNATDVPNAGALPSNAMVANTAAYPSLAALNLPMKRAREELSALTTDPPLLVNASRDELGLPRRVAQRPQSLRELLQLRGERCRQQQALWPGVGSERAGFGHLLLEERRQQQGERSAAQRVLWPRIGSESALPDDVLLGFSSDEPAFIQRSALSAPPPTQPCSVLPSPIPPQLAALPASAPCIGDFDPCCGELASCFGDAPSAGACAAAQHLVQSVDSCNGHSDLHDNKPDMPVHDTSNHDIPVNDNSNVPHGRSESLFLDAPISHLCLAEPTTTMPRAGESLAGQSHPTQGHQQQHLSGHQHCVQLTCVPSLSAHQPQPPPLSQPLAQPLMRPLSQVPLLSVFGNDSPQHSHDTLSHQKAPHMPAPVPPPALPHAQPHVIVSPPPTPMKPAVAPCFNVGDALGGDFASWESSFPPGLNSNVPSASSLLGFGETADLKVEEGWKMDMPGGRSTHDETYSSPDMAMLSRGLYPAQFILPQVLSSPHTLPQVHRGHSGQASEVALEFANATLPSFHPKYVDKE